mmetsp:Transcript_66278/g.104948  ORF Transcript_66278/g.104948 Transcript_66278/m.104948 type:complete len:201 (-) Transcript_66278:302-904(-)
MLLGQVFQDVSHQDVIWSAVGIEEAHFRGVLGVSENGCQHLVTRCETSAAGNHGDFLAEAGLAMHEAPAPSLVNKLPNGSFHINRIANLHAVQMLRHFAAFGELWMDTLEVHLHKEVHIAQSAVICHGRVGPHHRLAINLGLQGHVLTSGKPKSHRWRRQLEAEDAGVVVHDDLLRKEQLLAHLGIQKWLWSRDHLPNCS